MTAGSNGAIWCCWKPWAAVSPGVRRWSACKAVEVSPTLNDDRQLFVIDAFLPGDYGFGGRSGTLRATGERGRRHESGDRHPRSIERGRVPGSWLVEKRIRRSGGDRPG